MRSAQGGPVNACRLIVLVLTLAGMALTGSLGRWQLARAAEKQAMQAAEQAAERLPDADVGALLAASSPAQAAALMHRSIALRGRWLAERTVYLENRVMDQKAGFYVLTPLQLDAQGSVVLVARGWAPRNFDDRRVLPPVQTPASEVELRGRLVDHVPSFFALGAESPGPIRQNIDLQAYARESGLPLAALMVQQDGPPSDGLTRDWPSPTSGADKNFSYAFQWFSLCALMGGLFLWFQVVRPFRSTRRGRSGR